MNGLWYKWPDTEGLICADYTSFGFTKASNLFAEMAIGLDGMGRAEVLGDCMAALAGGTYDIVLAHSGISIRIPAYDLTHLDGTPRHLWCVATPVTADFGNHDDALLEIAIARLAVENGK